MKDIIKACLALVMVVALAIGVFWEGDKPSAPKAQENKVAVSDKMRIDIGDTDGEKTTIKIMLDGEKIKEDVWASKNLSKKIYVVQTKAKNPQIFAQSPRNIGAYIILRGKREENSNGKLIEHWVRYKSIKIDGKEQLKAPQEVWHNKPFVINYDMKKGKEYKIEVEWEPKPIK